MTWLITSDIHLSDRARDEHRFGLFKWLAKQQEKHQVTATFVLGDITEQKDKHSSKLVNRTVDELTRLRPPVYVLRGNHDCTDPNDPFFRFLNCIDGLEFVVEPTMVENGVVMIPHQRAQAQFDQACTITPRSAKGVMLHQTLAGAKAETGARLNGLTIKQGGPLSSFVKPRGIWAGDVHRPQVVSGVTYVGSPYHIRFGDDFTPRVLLVRDGVEQNLYYPAPRKWSLTIKDETALEAEELHPDDQVKLNLELPIEEACNWQEYKQRILAVCHERGLEVFGLSVSLIGKRKRIQNGGVPSLKTHEEVVMAYCLKEGVGNGIKRAGMEIVNA